MSRPRKLTDADHRYIRRAIALRATLTDKALAKKFGVNPRTIQYVNKPDPRKGKRAGRVPHETSALLQLLITRASQC